MFKSRYQEGHCNTNKEGLLASTLRPTLNPLPSQHSSPRDPLKMEVSACSSSDQNSQWLPISLGVKAEVCSEANQVLINALTLPDFFLLHLLRTLLPGIPVRQSLPSISPCWKVSNRTVEIFVLFTGIS